MERDRNIKVTFIFLFQGTVPPPKLGMPDVHQYFPWIPKWLDLNVVVPIGATVVVIVVGIIVICVAIFRRAFRGPEQTRLRGIE